MTINQLPVSWLPLIDAVAKTTIVLLAAGIVAIALRRASAALRHLVWTLALCSALALPALSLALPKWQLPLIDVSASGEPMAMSAAAAGVPEHVMRAPRLGIVKDSAGETSVVRSSSPMASLTWQQAVGAIWLLGAALILGRIVIGLVAVRMLSRRTEEITDAAWLPMAMGIARDMGITPTLRFLRSGRATMPVATGIFRPSVIVPVDADTWSESRLRIVLLHELAHVKRRDCLTHVLAQAACAFYWFNPLAWVAVKRARTERERACDDLVLACGTRGSEYADQLLEMARVLRGDRFPALIGGASLAMAHRSQLEGRLMAILDPRVPRSGLSRGRAFAAALLAFCTIAPLGALQPWSTGDDAVVPGEPGIDVATPVARVEQPSPQPSSAVATPQPDARRDREIAAERVFESATLPQPMPSPLGTPHPMPQAMPVLADHIAEGASAGVAEGFAEVHAGEWQEPKVAGSAERGGRQADPRMVAALTAALKDTDKEVRETAMQALVQMRDPSVFEPLVQALKDSSPDVREQAAFGLGQFRDRRAVQPLIGALKDENADVREQAAFALGQLRDPSSVDALGGAVRDANPSVREQAVFALGQIRDRRSVEPLISALKDGNADVREQAAFALGQIRERGAVDALMVAVRDPDADVREQVVFALGQLRDPKAIDALTTALKDSNAEVRKQAAFALGQLAR